MFNPLVSLNVLLMHNGSKSWYASIIFSIGCFILIEIFTALLSLLKLSVTSLMYVSECIFLTVKFWAMIHCDL